MLLEVSHLIVADFLFILLIFAIFDGKGDSMIYVRNTYKSKGSFNRSFNKSFRRFGGRGSFDISFDSSFATAEQQVIYVPKNMEDYGMLSLELTNVSDLTISVLPVRDLGLNRGYYTLILPILTNYPRGEYNYRLINAGGETIAQGILQVVGRTKVFKELIRKIRYKAYGRIK